MVRTRSGTAVNNSENTTEEEVLDAVDGGTNANESIENGGQQQLDTEIANTGNPSGDEDNPVESDNERSDMEEDEGLLQLHRRQIELTRKKELRQARRAATDRARSQTLNRTREIVTTTGVDSNTTTAMTTTNHEEPDVNEQLRVAQAALKANTELVEKLVSGLSTSNATNYKRGNRISVRDLPKFNGDPIDALEWLELFNEAADANQWDDEVKRTQARFCMSEGIAADWFRTVIATDIQYKSWDAFEIAFKTMFVDSIRGADRYQRLHTAQMEKDEKDSAFAVRVIKLARIADPNMPSDGVMRIIRSELPRRLSDFVERVNSPDQMVVIALGIFKTL